MSWVRQRLNEKCPKDDVEVKSSGGKYYPLPRPCIKGNKHFQDANKELIICEYLSQHFTGSWNTSVQCRFKASIDSDKKRTEG